MARWQLYKDTKFLVLDDQEPIRKDLVNKLIEVGFDPESITEAVNGFDGINKAKESDGYEFLITDMVMPEINGLEFIKQVRQLEPYKYAPLLVLSSETDFTIIKPAIAAGANNYMIKPPSQEVLAQKLIACIDHANKRWEEANK
jgi:two-component system chemotaxis response regulator CheY